MEATELAEFKADYDWQCAFQEAVNGQYASYENRSPGPIEHVTEVHYADEGERDERDWLAVGQWDDGQYFVMSAGCDYTGWD